MKKLMIFVVMVVALALPAMSQEWQSTSTMQGTGSSYAAQVTTVGATGVSDMATTTESYSPAKAPGGPRKSFLDPSDPGHQSNESPIGDAVLPMMLMALAFGGVVALRRRKALKS